MQINTTMRYHPTPIRMATIKTKQNREERTCWSSCGVIEPSALLVWVLKWYSHCGKQYGGSQQIKIELLCDPAIPSLVYAWKNWNVSLKRNVCIPVNIAILFTILKLGATQVSDRWMDKQNVVYLTITTWMNSGRHYTKWNRLLQKDRHCKIALIWGT